MRFLISLLLITVLASCSLSTTEGLREIPADSNVIRNDYFSNSDIDYVYKAKLDIYGNYFGGVLIIKKIEPSKHRVVFTTEFGTKLFDFLFENDAFTVLSIVEDLDRKLIVNTLQTDFETLLREEAHVVGQWMHPSHSLYQTSSYNRYNFYRFDITSEADEAEFENTLGNLQKIIHTSAHKEKFSIIFEAIKDQVAEKITIQHQNINLTIGLEKF